jgi:proline iminopeptidase
MAAAKAWSKWEAQTSTLQPSKSVLENFSDPFTAVSLSRIECHYFMNDSFLTPNQILDNAEKLNDIHGIIVQGRYDIVCPMESAWELHHAWSGSELQIIPDAGHSATERGIVDALVRATGSFGKKFNPGA